MTTNSLSTKFNGFNRYSFNDIDFTYYIDEPTFYYKLVGDSMVLVSDDDKEYIGNYNDYTLNALLKAGIDPSSISNSSPTGSRISSASEILNFNPPAGSFDNSSK